MSALLTEMAAEAAVGPVLNRRVVDDADDDDDDDLSPPSPPEPWDDGRAAFVCTELDDDSSSLVPDGFIPRPDSDIYVASYMKSGTTWLLHLAHQLASEGRMDYTHLNSVSPWLEALTPAELPEANALAPPRVLKSHLMPEALPPGRRVLYIVRDPRDVAVSLYYHAKGFQTFDGSLTEFVRYLTHYTYFGNFATWPEHVNAWAAAAAAVPDTILLLRYEDMVADLPACVRRVAAFCGLRADAVLCDTVLPRLSLEYMRANAARFDYSWRDPESAERFRFFRQGRAGAWTGEGGPGMWARFADAMWDRLSDEARPLFPTLLDRSRPVSAPTDAPD